MHCSNAPGNQTVLPLNSLEELNYRLQVLLGNHQAMLYINIEQNVFTPMSMPTICPEVVWLARVRVARTSWLELNAWQLALSAPLPPFTACRTR